MWYVYILRCSDESLYTGITKDLSRRLREHNTSKAAGAKYTRTRRPVKLLYFESVSTRSLAGKRERSIKRFSKAAKEKLALSNSKLK